MAYQDFDFMGFTYNGKHSYRDLGIYRVSSGDRYEETFTPTFQEKTASVDGMIGQYYFGQNIQSKQFNISFAFDHLTEGGIRLLKQTFNGDGIHDLIFDEHPYKVYSAKVTGSATMKTICFELEEGRVYRGEGTITFTCYYPYAHTPHSLLGGVAATAKSIAIEYEYNSTSKKWSRKGKEKYIFECGIVVKDSCTCAIPTSTNNGYSLVQKIRINYYANGKKQTKEKEYSITSSGATNLVFKAPGEDAYIESVEYIFGTNLNSNAFSGTTATKSFTPTITNSGKTYCYSNTGSNEDYCYREAGVTPNPKIINHYASYYYPTKREWYKASGLPLHTSPTMNVGDLPADFKVKYTPGTGDTNITFTVGSGTTGKNITINGITSNKYSDIVWDSKIGVVSAKVDNNGPKPIPCSGDICATIPVDSSVSVSKNAGSGTVTIEYDLWYY